MGWRQVLTDAVTAGVRSALRTATEQSRSSAGAGRSRSATDAGRSRSATDAGQARPAAGSGRGRPRQAARPVPAARYPGDLTEGQVRIVYAPNPNGQADPGEVVWAWVPYEDDASQGKDRPVLVVAEQDGYLIALMLTSRDHDADAARQAAAGRHWMDVGTGDWDRQRRPSEVRLDRVLRLRPDEVRREGGRLPKDRFDEVATELRRMHGWT